MLTYDQLRQLATEHGEQLHDEARSERLAVELRAQRRLHRPHLALHRPRLLHRHGVPSGA